MMNRYKDIASASDFAHLVNTNEIEDINFGARDLAQASVARTGEVVGAHTTEILHRAGLVATLGEVRASLKR